jgi:PAS domain S-box-containing protein
MLISTKDLDALKISGSVCIGLIAIAVIVLNSFTIPSAYTHDVIVILVILCIALITTTIHQTLQITETAKSIAENMTETLLLYSQELFTELYRNGPVPYMVIDAHGVIETINFATARLFHIEQKALDGTNFFTFLEGDDVDKIALIPEYFKQGKNVNDVEVEVRAPSGTVYWVMLSLFAFRDTNKAKKGMLTLVDITKQKMVDKAKTEFVSLASHQLRTPISTIKWNIGLLKMQLEHPEKTTDSPMVVIEQVNDALERMDLLISDFLSASRFELGTLHPEYGDVILADFFQSVYTEHVPTGEVKGVTIIRDWESVQEPIRSDTHLLHMMVSNLLGNAIKYTPTGGTVTVHAHGDIKQITITVRDTGMGIPESEQAMLFSKMFRASNARAQVIDGTGLGLYIVREAARTLGGDITFVSEEGKGSTFTIVLPK